MSTLDDVVNKLDVLIRLSAANLYQDKTQKEKIELLATAGLQPKQIAEMLGTTSNTVSVALSGMRKKKGQSKKKQTPKKEGQPA